MVNALCTTCYGKAIKIPFKSAFYIKLTLLIATWYHLGSVRLWIEYQAWLGMAFWWNHDSSTIHLSSCLECDLMGHVDPINNMALDRTPDSFALSNRNLWDFIGPWDVLMLKPSFSSSREKSKKGKSASFLLKAFLSPKNQVDHTESRESFQLENQNYTQRQTEETFHCVTSGELITWTPKTRETKRSATQLLISIKIFLI